MIIVLTRPHKPAAGPIPLGRWRVIVCYRRGRPCINASGLLEIEANGTFTLFIPSTIHASAYTQETTSYKCRQSHGQKFKLIYTLRALTDITKSN